MRQINKIILHCSASGIASHDNIQTIANWHTERGFLDIGYHYVIVKNGSVYEGRPLEAVGAHCRGQNHDSVGICLTGLDYFTSEQFSSLRDLVKHLLSRFNLTSDRVRLHSQYDTKKTCPNFTLKDAGL
jgi:N-acetylmuramoyl-L-alanine amidase